MARRIYLVRHGATEWTAAGRLQGQTDVPLSEEGRRQAREAARHLSSIAFDAAYTSDLSRALTTAETILRAQPGAAPLTTLEGLREISDGIYEGWSAQAAAEAEPRMTPTPDGSASALDFAAPGGESIRDVFVRQQQVAAQLIAEDTGLRILVVAHNWALRLLAAALTGRGPEWFGELESLRPASVSIVEIRGGAGSITLWNETGPLPPAHVHGSGASAGTEV